MTRLIVATTTGHELFHRLNAAMHHMLEHVDHLAEMHVGLPHLLFVLGSALHAATHTDH